MLDAVDARYIARPLEVMIGKDRSAALYCKSICFYSSFVIGQDQLHVSVTANIMEDEEVASAVSNHILVTAPLVLEELRQCTSDSKRERMCLGSWRSVVLWIWR
jgi:hypothetical protein